MAKNEQDFRISKQDLMDLMKAAGRAASKATIEEMEKQREKKAKQEADLRYKKTKERLKGYRLLKQKVETELVYTEAEQDYWRLMFLSDLIGDPSSYMDKSTEEINKEEADRRNDCRKLALTENALHLYEKDCEEHGKEVDYRRYQEMRLFYGLDEEPVLAAELAKQFTVTEKAIYKDIGIATRIMAVYLFGTP